MAASIPGATSHQRHDTRIMGSRDRATMGHWRRWDRSRRARVLMASMTWLGMSGNGSATGMTMTITKPARRGTRKDRRRADSKGFVAARGTAVQGHCAPRIGTGIRRRSGANTHPVSGVQRNHSGGGGFRVSMAGSDSVGQGATGASKPTWACCLTLSRLLSSSPFDFTATGYYIRFGMRESA